MSRPKKQYGLIQNHRTRNTRWAHDYDYIDKLSPAERRWLDKFTKEYYDGKVKSGDRYALHRTKKLQRDCYQRKNCANRDLLSIEDWNGKMARIEDDTDSSEG